jgi:hypothetical protein
MTALRRFGKPESADDPGGWIGSDLLQNVPPGFNM